jgi:hypothetical protein
MNHLDGFHFSRVCPWHLLGFFGCWIICFSVEEVLLLVVSDVGYVWFFADEDRFWIFSDLDFVGFLRTLDLRFFGDVWICWFFGDVWIFVGFFSDVWIGVFQVQRILLVF